MVLYLRESVSPQEVVDAIDNRRAVLINYTNKEGTNQGVRYIEPYVYGLTKAGNPCFRAYQYWGDSKRGVPKWKLFRLDRVDDWKPTENTFDLEPKARGWAAQAFNNGGDRSMSQVYRIVGLDGEEPLTDYEKLKARTQSIKNSSPVKIALQQQDSNRRNPIGNSGGKKKVQGPITNDTKVTQQQPQSQVQPQSQMPQEPENVNAPGPVDTAQAEVQRTVKPTQRVLSNDEFADKIRRRFNTQKQQQPVTGPVDTDTAESETPEQIQQETKPESEKKPGFFSGIINKLRGLFGK